MRLKLSSGLLIVSFLLSVLLSASSVGAGVYKWRDDTGKLHFTDDKSKIPLQYRSRGAEKMKGMIEPSTPQKLEAPVAAVEDPTAVENPDETAGTEPPAIEEKKDPTEGMDPKLVAMLNETRDFLENENKRHNYLIINVIPDRLNGGREYVNTVYKNLDAKNALVKKLRRFKLLSLKVAQQYLRRSAQRDRKIEVGGEDYIERLERLKKRMKSGIKTKKKILSKLKADLGEPAEES